MHSPEYRQRKNMKGFTSVELMVAMAVTCIIAGFLYSVYFFSMKLSKSWRERIAGEDTAVICMHRLTGDLIRTHAMYGFGEEKWILYMNDDSQIVYERQDDNLFRNGYRLNSPYIGIYGLTMKYAIHDSSNWENGTSLFDTSEADSILVNGDTEVPMVEVEMLVGDIKRQFTLRAVVYPRNADKAVFQTL